MIDLRILDCFAQRTDRHRESSLGQIETPRECSEGTSLVFAQRQCSKLRSREGYLDHQAAGVSDQGTEILGVSLPEKSIEITGDKLKSLPEQVDATLRDTKNCLNFDLHEWEKPQ
jgi:hypothetical protein